MLRKLGISRTQYYEDKAILEECGLKFKSHPKNGFVVESDTLGISRLTESGGNRDAVYPFRHSRFGGKA